jgi:hypothetical protein
MATSWQIFGFTISRGKEEEKQKEINEKSFALPQNDDGAVNIQTGAYFGTYVDLEGVVRNEVELITRYREMAMQPELETAIDDIVNESLTFEDSGKCVEIILDDLKQPETIKKRIQDEFSNVLRMLNFGNMGADIFRRWYIDGRIFYQVIIDETNPKAGIKELRYIDPRRIRKIREIQKMKDSRTGIEIIKSIREYYLYNERGVIGAHSNLGARISVDSVVNVNSGLMDSRRAMVLSYLHKAIKPLNQLRMVEDATVIYRLSRAPERRVFYIDVGNLPKVKAEEYLRDIMVKYRNKLVYDSTTGEIRDDRKHLSMLEDFWLPRREGGRGTEITTLQGAQNLGEMEDVKYFERKLYKSLSVPVSRLDPQQGFSLGRSAEITRDELKFMKFIYRLRNKFSTLFDDVMRTQLALKGICTKEEWDEFKEFIWYDFLKDNNFDELKDAELMQSRVNLLQFVEPFVGKYYSMEWVRKNVLQQTDEDIVQIDKQIEEDNKKLAASMPIAPGQTEQPGQPGQPGQATDATSDDTGKDTQPAGQENPVQTNIAVEPLDAKVKALKMENAINIVKRTLSENQKKVI